MYNGDFMFRSAIVILLFFFTVHIASDKLSFEFPCSRSLISSLPILRCAGITLQGVMRSEPRQQNINSVHTPYSHHKFQMSCLTELKHTIVRDEITIKLNKMDEKSSETKKISYTVEKKKNKLEYLILCNMFTHSRCFSLL